MHAENTQLLIRGSALHGDTFSRAVAASTEVGIVVPSILRQKLADAGYRINEDEDSHAEHGYRRFENLTRVIVHDKNNAVIAMGASADAADALLHAALGYVRERDIELFGFIVPLEFYSINPAKLAGCKLNGVEIPAETIQKLQAHLSPAKAA